MAVDWERMGEDVFRQVAATLERLTDNTTDCRQSLEWVLKDSKRWLAPYVCASADRFVGSEMDWKTDGARGFGRVTEAVPRLAGWQRGGFSHLRNAEAEIIMKKVAEILLRGYGVNLLMEGVIRKQIYEPQVVSEEQFWEKWVPLLYGSPMAIEALAPFKPVIQHITEQETEAVKLALANVGVRIGFMARPRLWAIVNGYLESGVLLRQLEVWGKFNESLHSTDFARPARPEWLVRFLNAYWGIHKSPEGLATKLKEDLDLEVVDADELWAYVAFVVANTALGSDFSQDEINEFFNIASKERDGGARYDALFSLIQQRVPQYLEVFSKLDTLVKAGMEGASIAAMRQVAENVTGDTGASARLVLGSMAADVAQKTREFVQTLA